MVVVTPEQEAEDGIFSVGIMEFRSRAHDNCPFSFLCVISLSDDISALNDIIWTKADRPPAPTRICGERD